MDRNMKLLGDALKYSTLGEGEPARENKLREFYIEGQKLYFVFISGRTLEFKLTDHYLSKEPTPTEVFNKSFGV